MEQLIFTSFLTLAWLILQVKAWPYRFAVDNSLKLVCELVIFGTVNVALAERSTDGGFEHAHGVYAGALQLMFLGIVPVCTLGAFVSKAMSARFALAGDTGLDELDAAFARYTNGTMSSGDCEILPVQPKRPSCSLQRALLTLKVNPGSLYRCGRLTISSCRD